MTNDILIRTYAGDAQWLPFCLASIRRHLREFRRTIVVMPRGHLSAFAGTNFNFCEVIEREPWPDSRPEHDRIPGHGADYFAQLWDKLNADVYSDADFITHVDSDMVFRRTIRPAWYFCDGAPMVWFGTWEERADAIRWKPVIEHMLGYECPYETMLMLPQTYPRSVYASTRAHMESVHGKTQAGILRECYLTRREPRFGIEFPTLGAHALRYHLHEVTARHMPVESHIHEACHHFWSFGGITPEIRKQIEEALA